MGSRRDGQTDLRSSAASLGKPLYVNKRIMSFCPGVREKPKVTVTMDGQRETGSHSSLADIVALLSKQLIKEFKGKAV